ncbi:MAG: flavin reductase [Oscillospiraceae bacterium]|nr:flavin reductase [Oscillospiraceae bacterium]
MDYKSINPKELSGNVFEQIDNRWFLVTAKKHKTDQKTNTMTASWGFMGIMWNKPILNCVIRPVRYTYEFMEEADYYTISFFVEQYRKALNILGTKSGRDADKIAESGLTPFEPEGFDGKVVSFLEAETIFVCKKLYYQDIDPKNFIDPQIDKNYPNKDYHRMYLGGIEQCLVKKN